MTETRAHTAITPASLQVVLDCPMDFCFSYIYQYEPYLKDPVGFSRIMVSLEKRGPPLHKCQEPKFDICHVIAADAGVFVLRSAAAHGLHIWPEHTWMQLDVGLDHLLCRRSGSGEASHRYCRIYRCCYLYSLNTFIITLAFSHCCLRPSGATSERLCTPALRSRTESHQISCGLLSPSTCSSLLCRLCWPCAATPALPFS